MTRSDTPTAQSRVVCAVDVGSTRIKASLWQGTDHVLAAAAVDYPSRHQHPAGDDPYALRRTVAGAIRTACATAVPDVIAVTAQMAGLAMLDHDGSPIGPLLSGVDVRAPRHGLPSDLRASGCADPGSTGIAKFLWYAESTPGWRHLIARVGGVKELIIHGLTGRWVTDRASASASGFYNLDRRGWSAESIAVAGLPLDALPEIAEPDSIAGMVERARASRWGVPSGIPVMVGTGDGPAASIAAGAVGAEILCLSCGTTVVARVLAPRPLPAVPLPTFTCDVAGRWQCLGVRFTVEPDSGALIPTGRPDLRVEPADLGSYLQPLVDAFGITDVRVIGGRLVELPPSWPVRNYQASDGGRALALLAHGVHIDDMESMPAPPPDAGPPVIQPRQPKGADA